MAAKRPLVQAAGSVVELSNTDTVRLTQLAVADGATTPDPGAPVWAWSTTENAPVYWSGSAWIKPATGASPPPLNTVDEVLDVDLYLTKYLASIVVSGSTTLDASLDPMATVTDGVFEGATLLIGGGPYCGLWTMGSVATLSAIPLTRWTDYGSGASLMRGTTIIARTAFATNANAGAAYPTSSGPLLEASQVDVANNRFKDYAGAYGPAFFRLTLSSGAAAPGGITPGVWYRLGDPVGGQQYGNYAASPVTDLAYAEIDITSTGVNGGSGNIGSLDLFPADISAQGLVIRIGPGVGPTASAGVSFASEDLEIQTQGGMSAHPANQSAGSNGYAAGQWAWARQGGTALGASSGAQMNSVAVGTEAWALGNNSIVLGASGTAYGDNSVAVLGASAGANMPNGGGGGVSLALGQSTYSDAETAFLGAYGGQYGFQQLYLALDPVGVAPYPRMLYTSSRQAADTPTKSGWWIFADGAGGPIRFDGYCLVTFFDPVGGEFVGHAVLRVQGTSRKVNGTAVPSLQYLVTELESTHPGALTLTLTPTSITLVSGDNEMVNVELSCSIPVATTTVSAYMCLHRHIGPTHAPSATYPALAVNRQERGILLTASEALAAGDFVNFWSDGGTAKMRKADASDDRAADGYVLQAVASGDKGYSYVDGVNTSASGLTVGPLYLGESGAASSTAAGAGSVVQSIGFATSATSAVFQRGLPVQF